MEDGKVNVLSIMPAPPPTAGGYDVGGGTISNQHGTLKPCDIAALTCSKCSYLLKDPQQVITCGHRYCQQCIEQMTNGE